MTFMDVWIGYAIFGVTLFSLVFAWAVRTRQFSDLDRGRYIPLNGGVEPEAQPDARRCRADRWGLRIMVLIAIGLLLSAVVIGIRNA